jgi:hypothetical protein
VNQFISSLITKLRSISTSRAKCKAGILALITMTATQNPHDVIDQLLQNDASYADRNSILGEIWRRLGAHTATGQILWEILKNKIETTETFSMANALYGNTSRRSSKVILNFRKFFSNILYMRYFFSKNPKNSPKSSCLIPCMTVFDFQLDTG